MGRVLLAGLDREAPDRYIAGTTFEKLTAHTIVDKKRFRQTIDQVVEEDFALVDQELEEGVRSIAAPIRNERGDVVAAMNVSCHASRVTVERMREEFRPHLIDAAEEIGNRVAMLPGS